ncbi:MAG: type II secretion system F family protein [Lentisphaeria bacterium]|nr:type II secretion system F family protein [Lentisphaeria bacterium]
MKKRIQFYNALATLEEAGVNRIRALRQHHPGNFGRVAKRMADMVENDGATLHEAMEAFPAVFSGFERAMVRVGERTGTLDRIFHSLEQWYVLVRNLRTQLITALLYPLLVYHVAAVLIPLINFFVEKGSLVTVGLTALALVSLPWALLLLVYFFMPLLRDNAIVGRLLLSVPLIGGILRKLDGSRFFRAYALSLRAGLGAGDSAETAAGTCANPALRRAFGEVAEAVRLEGLTFGEAYGMSPLYRNSETVASLIQTGEATGRMEEMAERVANQYQAEAETALRRMATILPVLAYLGLAAYIGFQIVAFYKRVWFDPINELL